MSNKVENQLTDELLPLLQKERYVLISTVDYETGVPNVSAISWVYAPDKGSIRFAVDHRSRNIENLKKNDGITLVLIGNESTYSISGKASVKVEHLEDVPLKLSCVEIKVSEVRDSMFYGAKISQEPEYAKTYDEEAAAKLDRQVMDAMKKA
jgi:hypothetical protein